MTGYLHTYLCHHAIDMVKLRSQEGNKSPGVTWLLSISDTAVGYMAMASVAGDRAVQLAPFTFSHTETFFES